MSKEDKVQIPNSITAHVVSLIEKELSITQNVFVVETLKSLMTTIESDPILLLADKMSDVLYSNLTPGEIERLALAVEEMGESLQVVGKILRHGYEATDSNTNIQYNNREDLETELGQVEHAIGLLTDNDLSRSNLDASKMKRSLAVIKYLHHQRRETE